MSFKETEQQISNLHARVKTLAARRDELIRKAGSEEQKLQEAFTRLRELGIENPEGLSIVSLEDLANQLQEQLATALTELEAKVTEGEQLLAKA